MKRLMVAATAALILCGPAQAAIRHDRYPLRFGSAGPNVAQVKYLLRAPRPRQNVFSQVKGTYLPKYGMGGYFNHQLGAAVEAYKWRLGYPRKWVKPVVGRYFIDILRGRRRRPVTWLPIAAQRLKAVEAAQPSKWAVKAKLVETNLIGIHEVPLGSQGGPCVSYPCSWRGVSYPALQSATGAYRAAWCVSTQQTVFKYIGYGTFADDTAGVYYAVDYANRHGWVSAKAKVGSLVAFIDYDRYGHRIPGTGHMGFVSKVTASGFVYIAGNDANAVSERYIAFGARPYVFIRLPGVA